MKGFFLALFLITNICLIQSQNIEIMGNGIPIASNGSNIPNSLDGTYFAETPVSGLRTQVFSITNQNAQDNVSIKKITVNSTEFIVENTIKNIKKGETEAFEIVFKPASEGLHTARVSIEWKVKKEEFVGIFNIEGLSSPANEGGNIMISQYYENGMIDHIEVKNVIDAEIRDNTYFLALYGANDDIDKAPRKGNSIEVGSMSPEEVRLFSGLELNGNEVIILSTSKGKDCYKDRVDMIGLQGTMWGEAKSFTKGGCATERAHVNFDLNDWVALENIKVDQAAGNQNIALGTYQLGPAYWNGSTWSDNSLPDLSRIVYIENDYDGHMGNIEACDLIINADVDFDKGGQNSIVVYRDLMINATLTLGDQESLVMYDDFAQINGTVTKKENSTYRYNPYDFTYWSSPISNGQISTVFSGVNPGRIFYYDQSKTSSSDPDAPDYWNSWVNATGQLIKGRGYAAEGVSGTVGVHSISFNGFPNNGIIFDNLYYWDDNDLDNDFNLIGNPYPSAIDIEKFFDVNSDVLDPVIYLWTHATGISGGDFSPNDYATYNYTGGTGVGNGVVPEKNIGSAQGFFVRAISSGVVEFNNSMRMEDSNDQFFKQTEKAKYNNLEKDRLWLNLTTDKGGFNQLLLGFIEGAGNGYDKGYDAIKLEGSNIISFYSLLDDKKMAIQGLGSNAVPCDIPLGFDSKVADRTLTISIERLEGSLKDLDIYLIDHLMQISHDLKRSEYSFDLKESGSFKDRFSIKFGQNTVLSSESIIEKNELLVYNKEDLFMVKSSENVKTIKLFDMLGKLILEKHPNDTSFQFNEYEVPKGSILLMEVIQEGNIRMNRKLIKH